MKVLGFVAMFFLTVALVVVLIGQIGLLAGRTPKDLGVQNGRLKPPSQTPNSVSSQADLYPENPQKDYARVAPFQFTGDGEQAMQKIATILKNTERTVIVTQAPDYLYAQSSSKFMKFTDDVEFWLDRSGGVIHVRSASRLGGKDFKVNRERVESIRAQFMQN